jgi:hypothetical protein
MKYTIDTQNKTIQLESEIKVDILIELLTNYVGYNLIPKIEYMYPPHNPLPWTRPCEPYYVYDGELTTTSDKIEQ